MCKYAGLGCAGYEKAIFFDSGHATKANEEGIARFRRPILTEEERKRMSQWLLSSVPPRAVLRVLAQIDEGSDAPQHEEIRRGPFGAFKVHGVPYTTPNDQDAVQEIDERVSEVDLVQLTDNFFGAPESTLSPWTQDLVHAIFDQPDAMPVHTSPEFWNMTVDPGCVQEIFDDHLVIPESREIVNNTFPLHDYSFPHDIQPSGHNQPTINPSISTLTATHDSVPQDAVTLLKHYASTVITLLTPLRHNKTPWHILFVPHIKHCLAAVALGEQVDHATLTAFYGSLAISAFSLGGVSQSQMWRDRGKLYKQQAREHARLMLHTAYAVPKTAKYKAILMALLTMVQLSMFAGTREQTDCYFVEAEKFIRLRGLNRKKSRKVRLLHHCYVFERLFHESTFIDSIDTQQRHHVRKTIESSGLAVHSRDSLSFRPPQFINLDEEMSEVKSQELGENDLHLECLGEFPPTLYPEIFGVPESWMLLLSLTIRLAKEKDSAEAAESSHNSSLKDFMTRAKAIERRIHRLQRSNTQAIPASSDLHVLDGMLDAVQQALAIYFYRRIYDVDASMLQQKVVGVRDCLLRCEYADPGMVHGSAGFLWSAFMAACEAEDPEVQVSFSHWFRTSAQRSGLSCFTGTLEIVEQVWQEKRTSGRGNVSWRDIIKRQVFLEQEH